MTNTGIKLIWPVMGEFSWHTCWSYCVTKVKPSFTFLGGAYMSTYILARVTVCHTNKRQLNFTCWEGKMSHNSSMGCANAKQYENIILQVINCYRELPALWKVKISSTAMKVSFSRDMSFLCSHFTDWCLLLTIMTVWWVFICVCHASMPTCMSVCRPLKDTSFCTSSLVLGGNSLTTSITAAMVDGSVV